MKEFLAGILNDRIDKSEEISKYIMYMKEKNISVLPPNINKSKDIFFYIRTKAPKSFIGNIWFTSKPINYAYAKSAEKFSATRKAIPKKFKVKPVNYNSKWFLYSVSEQKFVSKRDDISNSIRPK